MGTLYVDGKVLRFMVDLQNATCQNVDFHNVPIKMSPSTFNVP
jgi:hypothetical protein